MKHSLFLIIIIIGSIPCIYSKGHLREEEDVGSYDYEKFFSSLLAIFFSGLGDKSFLITAFMAMKYNKLLVFLSGFSALTLMGIISIQFGKIVSNYINEVYINIFGGVLFVIMGVYFIFIPIDNDEAQEDKIDEIEEIKIIVNNNSNLNSNNTSSRTNTDLNAFLQSFGLIFFSELGDKSQIAAIYISSNSSILMAFTAITISNAILTILGIFAGELVKTKLSKKTLSIISGVLFIVFGLIFLQASFYDNTPDLTLNSSRNNSKSTLLKKPPI